MPLRNMRPTNCYSPVGIAGPTQMKGHWGIRKPNLVSHTPTSCIRIGLVWAFPVSYIDEDNDNGIHGHESTDDPHRDSEISLFEDSMV